MSSRTWDVPGVTFSTLDSGLEIVSVVNKYASAKIAANGAHIIYKFTKNTTNDFHQRKQSSLKK